MILLIMLVILLSIYSVGISICYKKNEAGMEQQITKLWAEKEELELLQLLEAERKDHAVKDYEIFAKEYRKIVNKDGDQVPFVHNEIQCKINRKVKEMKRTYYISPILDFSSV